MPDENEDDLTAEEEAKFARLFAKAKEADAKEAQRKKPPKDFGDAVDRIADAVLDKLDARAADRRKAAEDEDEEPERGAKGGGFLQFLGGGGD